MAETRSLVRREITAQGRSRAFINGELATAGALKDLSARLIELHGQHEHHTLLDPATHLATLDAFGELDRAADSGGGGVRRDPHDGRESWSRLRQAAADRDARHDLLTFQLAELDRAAARPRAKTSSSTETRQVLASAERLERLCTESYAALYESDDAVLAAPGRHLAAGRGAGGARSPVSALPGSPRRHQVAARGSRAVSAPLRRRRSTRRRPACSRWRSGWRCSSGSSASTARRWPTSSRGGTRCGASWTSSISSGERQLDLERGYEAAVRAIPGRRAGDCRRRGSALAPGFRAAARTAAGGTGDGAHAVRRAVQRRTAAGAGVDGRRHRRGRVLHLAESGRGSAAAGTNRLRRRAVADHARHQDADRRAPSRLQRGRRPPAGRRRRRD